MITKVVCEACRLTYILHHFETTLDKLRCRCGGKLIFYRGILHDTYLRQSVNAAELELKQLMFEDKRHIALFEDFRQAAIKYAGAALADIKRADYYNPHCYALLDDALSGIYIAHNSIITAMCFHDVLNPDRASKCQKTQSKEKGGD